MARQTFIEIEHFQWDEENENHQTHGLNVWIADQVKDNTPVFFPNERDKTGSHKMIGPDNDQRFWTVILVRTDTPKIWRPITGWPSGDSELDAYVDARQKTPF